MKHSIKILPYGQNILNTWPEECFLFSLMGGVSGGVDWIMDSIIHISMYIDCNVPQGMVSFYPFVKQHQLINGMDFNPFITKYHIDKKLINSFCDDFNKIIIGAINNDFYLSTMIKTSMLIDNAKNYFHASYIYGYDLRNQIYYLNDNFYYGKNSTEKFPCQLVEEAYKASLKEKYIDFGNMAISFYKIKSNVCYEFSNEKLKKNIEKFLCSSPEPTECKDLNSYIWGISVYKFLQDVIFNIGDQQIDIRNFAFILDFENLNRRRIEFLIQKKKINNCNIIVERYNELYIQCKLILQLCLKYNVTKNREVIVRIIKNLNQLCLAEKVVLEDLYERL